MTKFVSYSDVTISGNVGNGIEINVDGYGAVSDSAPIGPVEENKAINPNFPGDSFVRNCHLRPRNDEGPLFYQLPDTEKFYLVARLDGYTILPNEEYQALLSLKSSATNPPEPSAST